MCGEAGGEASRPDAAESHTTTSARITSRTPGRYSLESHPTSAQPLPQTPAVLLRRALIPAGTQQDDPLSVSSRECFSASAQRSGWVFWLFSIFILIFLTEGMFTGQHESLSFIKIPSSPPALRAEQNDA